MYTWENIKSDFKINKYIYLMAVPVLAYYLIFHYLPIYGAIIAFKDFSPTVGILGSKWVGFKHFESFFHDIYFFRIIKNTLLINLYGLIFEFPAPIILALLMNEIRGRLFKKSVQTITYLPHFISLVVICGMIKDFVATKGVVNYLIQFFGFEASNLLVNSGMFRIIYISSDIWQHIGWGSIIYLAALAGIDQQQYEAAVVDGAGRFKQLLHVTLPGITPTIVILFILRMGRMMSVGFEKIILLYNPLTYETADVISSYVYRVGLLNFNYSFSTAVGLFNALINFALLFAANRLSRKVSSTSLW